MFSTPVSPSLQTGDPLSIAPTPPVSLSVLSTSSGVSALIVPNEFMSVQGMQSIHTRYPDSRILVLDNNPFNHVDSQVAQEYASQNREWLSVVDHHGHYNDGVPRATLSRLFERLEELSQRKFIGENSLLVTNAQNLDPDGVLSFYAASNPERALLFEELLTNTTNYTDFALFGGDRFDSSFRLKELPIHKVFGLALLQLITEEKGWFVERATGAHLESLDTNEIRRIFLPSHPDECPLFNHAAVRQIYFSIINHKIDGLLSEIETGPSTHSEVFTFASRAVEKLQSIYRNAQEVTERFGASEQFPHGKIAVMSETTGFKRRLDDGQIYDWLLESAAQYCTEAPLHLRFYKGMLVLSVRHARPDEPRRFDFNVSPLIARLNQELSAQNCPQTLYGRKEVVLGAIDKGALPIQRIASIVLEEWHNIVRPI